MESAKQKEFKSEVKYYMQPKYFYGILLILVFASCKKKQEMHIQFSINGKTYKISENDKKFSCELTYDTLSNKAFKPGETFNNFKDRGITFLYIAEITTPPEEVLVLNFFFKMCSDYSLQDSAKVIYEDFTCNDKTAGYKSVIKVPGEISARFKFKEGGGTDDKFHLSFSISNDFASGTFSGELSSDFDNRRIFIKDGSFQNIPFRRRSID